MTVWPGQALAPLDLDIGCYVVRGQTVELAIAKEGDEVAAQHDLIVLHRRALADSDRFQMS